MAVVDGVAGYVPLYRIDREEIARQQGQTANGTTAVPGRDENHITMASEATSLALQRSTIDTSELDGVFSASVTDPFAEHGISAHVAYRLGATGDVRTADFRGSLRAATDALTLAVNESDGQGATILVVGVDIMPVESGADEEIYAGAGAGAAVLTDDAPKPDGTIEAFGQETTGFVERHRLHGDSAELGDPAFEGQHGTAPAIKRSSKRALQGMDDVPSHTAVVTTHNRITQNIVDEVPGAPEHVSTFESVGYAGTGSFYLDLAHLIEETSAGSLCMAATYGAGGADTLLVRTGEDNIAPGPTVATQIGSKETLEYGQHLTYRDRVEYQGSSVL